MLMLFLCFRWFTYSLKPPIFRVIFSCFSWEIAWEHGMWSFCYISVFQLFIRIESDDIAMNNEEQDVKNILVLKNWLKTIRKEMKQKFLCISHLQGYFAFPIFENMTLKKI